MAQQPGDWGPDGNREVAVSRGAVGWGIQALQASISQVQGLVTIGLAATNGAQAIQQMQAAHDQLRRAFDESAQ
jgi:hypothetical protein